MLILHSPQILHQKLSQWKIDHRVHLVPTMGCLHRGHLSLIERAQQEEGKVIVSIFVNPLQFAPGEDFEKYPRPLDDDIKLLEDAGIECLFAPRAIDLYPEGFATSVLVGKLTDHLCGKSRPGHFDGVATVCLKLFQITQADTAVFGEKDFQQLRVLERMVEDLNLSVQITRHAIVREPDGVAFSSRNRLLSAEHRELAAHISLGLFAAREAALFDGTCTVQTVTTRMRAQLPAPFEIDYVAIASSDDLQPVAPEVRMFDIRFPRLFVAVRLGGTRLIDNLALYLTEAT